MDLQIYNEINDFYDFFYKDDSYVNMLNNIDSLKNGFKDSFSNSKCKKIFSILIEQTDFQESKRLNNLILPELKGIILDLISGIINLYKIHSIVENLIIFFYITKYKCCNRDHAKIFFELSLRKYMGFFLEPKIINIIFECESIYLISFVRNGLFVLNESTYLSRKCLINYFYKYHFDNKFLMKEYSETQSVFNLTDFKNKATVNICAGNALGIHLLKTKMTCIDLNKYIGMDLLNKMHICNFVECNIFEKSFETISSIFNLWIAIHACRKLSIRIIEVFQKCASTSSELYLVPCCLLRKIEYKILLGDMIYNRIYKLYHTPKGKMDLEHCNSAMHIELLSSLCINYRFKLKTLRDMNSTRNKILILYK